MLCAHNITALNIILINPLCLQSRFEFGETTEHLKNV